jgi:hypothetical protein
MAENQKEMSKLPIDLSQIDPSVNQNGASLDEVNKRLLNGIDIYYGDFRLRVERSWVDVAREDVVAIPDAERRKLLQTINDGLRKSIPKLRKLSKGEMDDFVNDLILWHVLTDD